MRAEVLSRVACTGSVVLVALLAVNAKALSSVELAVDTAPNEYCLASWAPWWADAQTEVVRGSSVNIQSGMYVEDFLRCRCSVDGESEVTAPRVDLKQVSDGGATMVLMGSSMIALAILHWRIG